MNNKRIRFSNGFVKAKMLTGILLAGGIALGCVVAYFAMSPDTPVPPPVKQISETERLQRQVQSLVGANQQLRAIDLLKDYRRTHPDDPAAGMMLAEIYLRNERIVKCQTLLDEILKNSPNHPDALWLKGIITLATSDDGRGWEYLVKAADQPNTTPAIWGRYGVLLEQKNRFAEAESYLQRAIERGERDPKIMYSMGRVKFERSKYDDALKYATLSTQGDPEYTRGWLLLSDVQRNLGQKDEALESLLRAKKVSQGMVSGVIDMRLGRAYELKKEWLRAAEHYGKAEAFRGLTDRAAFNAANCYYQAGKFAQGMKHIDIAVKLTPSANDVLELKKKIEDARFGTTSKPDATGSKIPVSFDLMPK
ncbi:MAG: tetratricopeptide repeat protein [Phycisphaerae bacterium]|nr:tetratricopeptide repeat protein [Phycisphaerae bacterium]